VRYANNRGANSSQRDEPVVYVEAEDGSVEDSRLGSRAGAPALNARETGSLKDSMIPRGRKRFAMCRQRQVLKARNRESLAHRNSVKALRRGFKSRSRGFGARLCDRAWCYQLWIMDEAWATRFWRGMDGLSGARCLSDVRCDCRSQRRQKCNRGDARPGVVFDSAAMVSARI